MYDWLRGLNLPFMAGSSIQVTVRVPELEIPDGANIRRAVLVCYGGTDSYGFHTLEAMQSEMVASAARAGGTHATVSALWR